MAGLERSERSRFPAVQRETNRLSPFDLCVASFTNESCPVVADRYASRGDKLH